METKSKIFDQLLEQMEHLKKPFEECACSKEVELAREWNNAVNACKEQVEKTKETIRK